MSSKVQLLEKGGNSKVFLFNSEENKQKLVLKAVPINSKYSSILLNEWSIMKDLDHPNIVKAHDLKLNQQFLSTSANLLILEHASRKSLWEIYKKLICPLDIRIVRNFFIQILDGMSYLHLEKNIAHRDIKMENILIFDDFTCKICDFGYSKVVSGEDIIEQGCNSYLGTKSFMAPEIAIKKNNEKYIKQYYDSKKADIFSLGVLLFCMIFNQFPFQQAIAQDSVYQFIINNQIDKFWAFHQKKLDQLEDQIGSQVEDLKQLLQQMLAHDPKERPGCDQIQNEFQWIEGPIIKKIDL